MQLQVFRLLMITCSLFINRSLCSLTKSCALKRRYQTARMTTSMTSAIEKVVLTAPSSFDETLRKLELEASSSNRPLFLLFTGEKSKETGRSWCPDCVAAEPIIDKVLARISGGCILLEMPVVREEYRSPTYAYRIHPGIALKCVPTTIKWVNGKQLFRLNDSQSQVEGLMQELVEA